MDSIKLLMMRMYQRYDNLNSREFTLLNLFSRKVLIRVGYVANLNLVGIPHHSLYKKQESDVL
jgi:hypothetical protein